MATTLLTYATNERDTYKIAVTVAQAALTAAQGKLAVAQKTLGTDAAAAKAKDDAIAQKRAQLATTTVPSEGKQLVDDITLLTVERRELQQKLLDDQGAVDIAAAAFAFAQNRLNRARTGLAEADKFLVTIIADSTRRSDWKDAATEPPLSTVAGAAGDASTMLGSVLYTEAKGKFAATVVPAKLLEIAETRYKGSRARLKAAEGAIDSVVDHLAAQAATDGGLPGTAEDAGHAFRRAERSFGSFIAGAKQNLDRAKGLLEKIGDSSLQVLTVAEIRDALDAAKLAAREASEGKEKAVIDAQGPVDTAQGAIDDAILKARAKNPNANDAAIDADADVVVARAALTAPKAALDAALAAFVAADKSALASWQAVLPDRAWQLMFDFFEATTLLNDLKSADPTALQTDMDTKEGDYGDALAALATSSRASGLFADSIDERQALANAALAAGPTRLFSALRGDSN